MKKFISAVLTLLMIIMLAEPNICLADTNVKDISQVKLTNKKDIFANKAKKVANRAVEYLKCNLLGIASAIILTVPSVWASINIYSSYPKIKAILKNNSIPINKKFIDLLKILILGTDYKKENSQEIKNVAESQDSTINDSSDSDEDSQEISCGNVENANIQGVAESQDPTINDSSGSNKDSQEISCGNVENADIQGVAESQDPTINDSSDFNKASQEISCGDLENVEIKATKKAKDIEEYKDSATNDSGDSDKDSQGISYGNIENADIQDVAENQDPKNDILGKCSMVSYSFTENGTLTISGHGKMKCNFRNFKSDIKHLIIENGITSISPYSFKNCKNLTSIDIPETVKGIGGRAFEGCESLKSIRLPSSLSFIQDRAFLGCKNLTSIDIPETVKWIERGAFAYCKSLTSIDIPETVKEIGEWAFAGCENLQSIKLPRSLSYSYIQNCAFKDCKNLTSIVIPKNVKEIGEWAFAGCESLKSVDIVNKNISIEESAFTGCKSLSSITYQESDKISPEDWLPLVLTLSINCLLGFGFLYCGPEQTAERFD